MPITEKRVREGEPTEALCFQDTKHPRIEIAAQHCGRTWCVFYVSPGRAVTLYSGRQEDAEKIARAAAGSYLHLPNPTRHID